MKFYQLSTSARLAQLVSEGVLTLADADWWGQQTPLPAAVAENLSENQIGQFALPVGVARELVVNGTAHQVPMATEEPSVVAAASNGARIAKANGGVQAHTGAHLVVGEIVFDQVQDLAHAQAMITQREPELFAQAQAVHPSIVRRGGGLRQVTVQAVADFLKVSVQVDTQEAMGANIVNTICEHLAAVIGGWLDHPALVAILSNQSTQLTQASVRLSPESLATKDVAGQIIAQRIARLSDLAQVDEARAVTHNKGIMNGITAAVLATGNDTRAVAAAVHAYAAASGQYRGLSRWWLADGALCGELRLPLPVGTVGGAISALPAAAKAMHLAAVNHVAELQNVLAALGLVQNLAALRALAGPGIQAGHMRLQANALAMQAGASGEEIGAVAQALQETPKDLAHAQAILTQLRSGGQQ